VYRFGEKLRYAFPHHRIGEKQTTGSEENPCLDLILAIITLYWFTHTASTWKEPRGPEFIRIGTKHFGGAVDEFHRCK